MTADGSWGTSTSPRPEPLADRRYPRCGVCSGPWHGLPTTFLGTWCETSIDELRRGA